MRFGALATLLLANLLPTIFIGCQKSLPPAQQEKSADASLQEKLAAIDREYDSLRKEREERYAREDQEREQASQQEQASREQEAARKAQEREQARLQRIAMREDNPQLTPLVYEVQGDPGAYYDKCVCFDQVAVGGDVQSGDGHFKMEIRDDRGEWHTGFGDDLLFICSKGIANAIRQSTRADGGFHAKIYCQIVRQEKEEGTTITINGRELTELPPIAEVYKIEVHNMVGGVHSIITEQGREMVTGVSE